MAIAIDQTGTVITITASDADGISISNVTAAGTDQASATVLKRMTVTGVYLVTCDKVAGIMLPTDAFIGDVVELHLVAGGYTPKVYPPIGSTIGTTKTNEPYSGFANMVFRKAGSTSWLPISGV